jgi:beta-fructofuranosidase
MKISTAIGFHLAALVASHIVPRQNYINQNASPPNLSTLSNASLYLTWRPKSHVLPTYGQIGDPCMHWVSPETGLFHVGYLHGGGASGATTSDLVTYNDLNANSEPFIRAGGINDPIAVFDGSVIEKGINGTPTLLYTSVSYLPIQWTIKYTKGSETQSLATAIEGGRNFTKVEHGPVIPSPPFAVNVTGFQYVYSLAHR